MQTVYAPLLAILAAYLLGSIPFAMISSRLFGLADPRSYGSGNPGATNVLRSGNKKAALVTLQTIELLRTNLGVNINLGASNVSFGLPDRPSVNQTFLAMTIQAGATCAITDPVKLGAAIRASDLLLGRDDYSMRYIKYFRATEALKKKEAAK